uniref:Solute carrier family 25 member 27 n=1 Tax=Astyanax mexicanus TaxID=7994 RepID=W5KSW8_ASTMX
MGPEPESSLDPRVSKFLLSAFAATVAELVTFPLDLTKTRLQVQGEAGLGKHVKTGATRAVHRGMLSTAVGIVREEGPLKLWQGATPAIYRHIVYSGGRMVAYEQLRESVLRRSEDGSFSVWYAAVGGMVSGAFGQFLASPTDLVKVQMQMEGRRRLEGKPPRVRGVYHAFVKIISEGGIRGLWWLPPWCPSMNSALTNTSNLITNWLQLAPRKVIRVAVYILFTPSLTCSGLVAATMGTPADVVKTRIMNQPRDSNGRGLLYKSSIDCLVQSVKGEGFLSLYKGFLPTWLRMAPWSMTFWLTYEQIRRVGGISSF